MIATILKKKEEKVRRKNRGKKRIYGRIRKKRKKTPQTFSWCQD